MKRDFGEVTCCVCGETARKRGARQVTCGKDECKKTNMARKQTSWKRNSRRAKRGLPPLATPSDGRASGTMRTALGGAIADVVILINQRRSPPSRATDEVARRFRRVIRAHDERDRVAYHGALQDLAEWTLLELSHVRRTDDATPS